MVIHGPKYDQLVLHCDIPRNCWKKLSISAGGDRKKLRRLSRMLCHFRSILCTTAGFLNEIDAVAVTAET